jgi:hypothetical protein
MVQCQITLSYSLLPKHGLAEKLCNNRVTQARKVKTPPTGKRQRGPIVVTGPKSALAAQKRRDFKRIILHNSPWLRCNATLLIKRIAARRVCGGLLA